MIQQEFDRDIGVIKTPAHIEKVWTSIQDRYTHFLEHLLQPVDLGLAELAALGRIVRSSGGPKRDPAVLMAHFSKAIERFEKTAPKYRDFFNPAVFEEYEFAKGSFKPELGRKCPILRQTLNSKNRELLDWRKKYNLTPPTELFDVFGNILNFATEYFEESNAAEFARVDGLAGIDFDTIEDDENCRINGVIGMGIKSAVLYHLDPGYFPARDSRSLLGFYLLSGCSYFGLPSKSSEFVMYDPERQLKNGSLYASHNFWYPYALFTLYSLRLYRLMKLDLEPLGVALDDGFRFVYTTAFLKQVCALETAHIQTFLARDVIGDYDEDYA